MNVRWFVYFFNGVIVKLLKALGIIVLILSCYGCASRQLTAEEQGYLSNDLICKGQDQCATYWQRAQIYVAKNSELKIQIANDYVIQTNPSPKNSVIPSYIITKSPKGKDEYIIDIQIDCPNIYGLCHPASPKNLLIQIKKYIMNN